MLLIGEPGSGKSVALRHLAYQIADLGTRSTDPKAKIPLYVNLKELPRPPDGGPTADWIRTFVIDNVRRGDADTAEYIKEYWDAHLHDGLWLFLFDSFDEISEVMHAPAGSTIIQKYSEAIRQFLASMSDCRSVLASREFKGPESLPWQKVRILPLSIERQDELIEKTFLPAESKSVVRKHLAESNSNLRQSPLFLALLCRHVKQERRAPANDHDLLSKHIGRLAERDQIYIQDKYGLTSRQLLDGATELAVLFATDSQLSLAPTHDQIAAALSSESFARQNLDALLPALIDVKIGRSDVQESKHGDRRFTFSHRRYQETLFVRHLALNPQFISVVELLVDKRWREYAVAFLQSAEEPTLKPILDAAKRAIEFFEQNEEVVPVLPGFGSGLSYYSWDYSERHLLALLQEGLGRRPEIVPPTLTSAVERMLAKRWSNGDIFDRVLVILNGGLLPDARLSEYLTFAVELKAWTIQDVALERFVFLRNISVGLAKWIRRELAAQSLRAHASSQYLRLQALAGRLPVTVGADVIVRRGARLQWMLPLALVAKIVSRLASSDSSDGSAPAPANASTRTRRYSERYEPQSLDSLVFSGQFLVLSFVVLILRQATSWFWFWFVWGMLLWSSIGMVGYLFCRVVDGSVRDYVAELSESRLRLVLVGLYFLVGFGAVYYGGKGVFWGTVASISTGVAMSGGAIWEWLSRRGRQKKQLKRLDRFLAQSPASSSFVLQAESLDELYVWMVDSRQPVAYSAEFSRSLSRAVLYGVERVGGSSVEPPLIEYLAACEYRKSGKLPPRIGAVMSTVFLA